MPNGTNESVEKEVRENYEAQLESAVVDLEYHLTKALGALASIRFFTDKLVH